MKSLAGSIDALLDSLGKKGEAQAKARRAAFVAEAWRKAVCCVYRENADLVLSHINGVYIIDYGGAKSLTVYADDGLIRTDLDAKQEFLKIALRESGEVVETFRIFPAKAAMRQRHPFAAGQSKEPFAAARSRSQGPSATHAGPGAAGISQGISQDDQRFIDDALAKAGDTPASPSLKRAMTAYFENKPNLQ